MMRGGIIGAVSRFASRLRFPYLLLLTCVMLVITLFVPDPFLFADEILLALLALVLAGWRKRRSETEDAVGKEQGNRQ